MDRQILEAVERTPFVDTHEHLVEESQRLSGQPSGRVFSCPDWANLFQQYMADDLHNAGMASADQEKFFAPTGSPSEKFKLVAPYWRSTKNTGYAQAIRRTLRKLYGEDDLTAESAPRIAEKYKALIRPGFYRRILCDLANLECCHVNSLQRTFVDTEQPDLLPQDLSILRLGRCNAEDIEFLERECGKRPKTLEGWLDLIDWHFSTYGSRAIAVKSQNAYERRLNYDSVPRVRVEALYQRQAGGDALGQGDAKALNDFVFRYCVAKATEFGLPVKLHTGYYVGHGFLPLDRLSRNADDVRGLLEDYPDTKFVLMHMGYPYQDEFVALGKHYRNAYVDMCWAWIINPLACVRFLREFLVTAPANKVFGFGGDYEAVELVYGHSEIARQGIAQALSELVADGWVTRSEAYALIDSIMRLNANAVFSKPKNAVRKPKAS